jgi:predicted phosphodiesterase
MAVYIAGDTHGTYDVNKILKLKPHINADDYLIILGDFALCRDNGPSDRKVRNFWNIIKAHILFIDGNHENYTLLNSYPVTEKFGGKVHEISGHITHLMRGQVFTIENKTFFTMGGAASRDCGSPLKEIISAHTEDYFTYDFKKDYDNLFKYERRNCRDPGRT